MKDEATKKSKALGDRVKSLGKSFTSLSGILTGIVAGIGFKKLFDAYAKQEEAETRLQAALKTTGQFSEEVNQALLRQASGLQQVTTFGDEAFISSQALLTTYGLTAAEIEKALPAIANFAAATGKDLRMATELAGRSMMGQTSVMRTYGVTVDETEAKSDSYLATINALNKGFEGQAEAIAKSGTGPLKQMWNSLGDVGEQIIKVMIPSINEMVGVVKDNMPFIQKAGIGIGTVIKTIIQSVIALGTILKDIIDADIKIVNAAADSIASIIAGLMEIVQGNFKSGFELIKEGTSEGITTIVETVTEGFNKTLENATESFNGIVDSWADAGEKMLEIEEAGKETRIASKQDEANILGEIEKGRLKKTAKAEKKATGEKKKEVEKRVQTEIESANVIANSFNASLADMLAHGTSYEQTMGGFFESLKGKFAQMVADMITKELVGASATKAVETTKAGARAVSAYAGMPFIGLALGLAAAAAFSSAIARMHQGGRVPGPKGKPVPVIALGGEEFIPPGQEGRGMGGTRIGTVIIQFPEVTTFQDWMDASPARVKEVTERKILQALSTLEDEGKIAEGTVLI